MSPLLEADHLAKSFGSPPVHALRDLSLTVKRGEALSVMGPSGSGKSTLLAILGLLEVPTSGSLRFDGDLVSEMSDSQRAAIRRDSIGFVFQGFHLVPYRSATRNVEIPLRYAGVTRAEAEQRSNDALERVGLAHRADALPSTMSGGEQQRVAIARAIVTRPSLILCDEPTGSLDSTTGASVMSLLLELNRDDGTTLIIVSHDPTVARATGRIMLVKDGTVERDVTGVGT